MLFQAQFKMNTQEEVSTERFANFAIRYYVPNWFLGLLATLRPKNNLKNRFLFFLDTFHQIQKSEKNIDYNMSYDSSTEFFKKWSLF